MYQFLCVDANTPPPYLEVHWRHSSNGSFDEMEMEEMFGQGGQNDEEFGMSNYEEDGNVNQQQDGGQVGVFQTNGQGVHRDSSNGHMAGSHGMMQTNRTSFNTKRSGSDTIDDDDDINMESLSMVQGEFMYEGPGGYDQIVGDAPKGMSDDMQQQVDAHRQVVNDGKQNKIVNLDSFHIIKVIGKGSFGKVFLVRHKARKTLHALKVLKKDFIIRKNQVEHTKTERSVLGYINHPYIVGLTMAFQTADKLFFVLDYCAGGELFFHLGKLGRFPEERAKFYAAQITLALEYVHNLGVIYRDLKPENVLLDNKGNVRLTDFGLSKEGVRGHSSGASSFCGTPEYIAPEVLKRQGHGRAVDWWSLGALLYEMISGLPPFYSRNRETMFDKIMKAEITFPQLMSAEARDILSRLLVRDPQQRLGSGEGDAEELKAHPFFRDIDWATLATGTVIPPWAPMVNGSLDTSQFDEEFTSMMPAVSPDVRDAYFGTFDSQFEGFTFVDDSAAEHLRAHHESSSYISSSLRSGAGATLMATSLKKR